MSISDQRRTRNHSLEVAPHRFSVGQIVRLKSRFGVWLRTDEVYRITARLPAQDNSLQYRIRSDNERHERVAMEDDLELVPMSPSVDSAVFNSWTSQPAAEGSRTTAKGQKRRDR